MRHILTHFVTSQGIERLSGGGKIAETIGHGSKSHPDLDGMREERGSHGVLVLGFAVFHSQFVVSARLEMDGSPNGIGKPERRQYDQDRNRGPR